MIFNPWSGVLFIRYVLAMEPGHLLGFWQSLVEKLHFIHASLVPWSGDSSLVQHPTQLPDFKFQFFQFIQLIPITHLMMILCSLLQQINSWNKSEKEFKNTPSLPPNYFPTATSQCPMQYYPNTICNR